MLHLDNAACSRQSRRTLHAASAHLRRETEIGGYEAEADARPVLDRGRAAIGALVGMSGHDVAFTTSAQAALAALLDHWPIEPGDEVACLPGEYGPTLAAFTRRGLRIRVLPTDPIGRLDVAALRRHLSRYPPSLLHLTHVASHRGTVQRAADVAVVCRSLGIPMIVDAAQSLGQVDTVIDADAIYATSRKWLSGPRGVGVLAVRPAIASLLRVPRDERDDIAADANPVLRLEPSEGHIAGRVALCTAVDELLAASPGRAHERLAALGRITRSSLDGIGGWRVIEPIEEPTAATTLVPRHSVSVSVTQTRLHLEHRILTSGIEPSRAPREMSGPVLRVSPHLGATSDDIRALASALNTVSTQ